ALGQLRRRAVRVGARRANRQADRHRSRGVAATAPRLRPVRKATRVRDKRLRIVDRARRREHAHRDPASRGSVRLVQRLGIRGHRRRGLARERCCHGARRPDSRAVADGEAGTGDAVDRDQRLVGAISLLRGSAGHATGPISSGMRLLVSTVAAIVAAALAALPAAAAPSSPNAWAKQANQVCSVWTAKAKKEFGAPVTPAQLYSFAHKAQALESQEL